MKSLTLVSRVVLPSSAVASTAMCQAPCGVDAASAADTAARYAHRVVSVSAGSQAADSTSAMSLAVGGFFANPDFSRHASTFRLFTPEAAVTSVEKVSEPSRPPAGAV